MDVAVVGAGAIGSTIAAMLTPANQVTLVGHDTAHVKRLRNEPLSVRTPDGMRLERTVTVTTDHEAVAGSDLVVLAVKSYDTETALTDIEPFVSNLDVLTVQNGLGNIEAIRERIDPASVIGGTTTMGATLPRPGVVRIESYGTTRIGRPWADNETKLAEIQASFQNGGFPTQIDPSIRHAIWEKVLVNVGINPITALTGVQNGALVNEPGRTLLEQTIKEAQRVAVAEGYEIDDAVDTALSVAQDTAHNYSSMLRDVKAGNKTEVGALNGAIVERADSQGISVPVNRTLTAVVRLKSS